MDTLSVRNGFYKSKFSEIKKIIEGRFYEYESNQLKKITTVYEVEDLNIKQRFAIKRIQMKNNEQTNDNIDGKRLSELQMGILFIKKLRHENIVQYYDIWLENENHQNVTFAFIQMELCDKSLYQLIRELKEDIKIYDDDNLTKLGYYILSEIFRQILEGILYLHEQSPQIIHRNLNLYDILVLMNYPNKSVVKIAAFGLSCLHYDSGESQTQDTWYLAPEGWSGTIYDTRLDIYSLGIVLQKIFLIDANRDYTLNNESSLLMNKYQNIKELFIQMTDYGVDTSLQTCRQILDKKHLWALNESEFNPKREFLEFCDNCDEKFKKGYEFKFIKLLLE